MMFNDISIAVRLHYDVNVLYTVNPPVQHYSAEIQLFFHFVLLVPMIESKKNGKLCLR